MGFVTSRLAAAVAAQMPKYGVKGHHSEERGLREISRHIPGTKSHPSGNTTVDSKIVAVIGRFRFR